ncbi:hypothetical protein ABFT23_02180 [Nocardioides sp. C4-1]|uniref:hypothetical protein n=1 Tax=Nocardioides sp. C4-1 TaxID=3151851 RepID=UPI003267C663
MPEDDLDFEVQASRRALQRRVREYSEACGSNAALARECEGVSDTTIGKWIRGAIATRTGDVQTAEALDKWASTTQAGPVDTEPTCVALHDAYCAALAALESDRSSDAGATVPQQTPDVPDPGETAPAVSAPADGNDPNTDTTAGVDSDRQLSAQTPVSPASGTAPGSGSAATVSRWVAPVIGGLVLVGAVTGVVLSVTGNSGSQDPIGNGLDENSSANGPSPDATEGVSVDEDLTLDDSNFCVWQLGTHPAPLVSRDPLLLRVDARCNDPAEPDPLLDVGASVFSEASNANPDLAVGRVKDNVAVVPVCFVADGDRVTDASTPPNSSPIWVKIDKPVGFVPNVNLGGGYTLAQLTELGLREC